ncbi:CocE/NonD family hydrolase [Streptomyces sp. PCS3-D2]|uniref:CocE/NonD family hydrolase n=1 Tax=Streptomyces sp. PCS3-D2 TaxID=1460244 RepID=UPI001F014234|nr:CocE/NonD family hydrolase [Streptomyces sp. PCS3-D2]WKV70606.1 CocE/NonD family hydrolase [Streptomyces sp. PCS3-D2]
MRIIVEHDLKIPMRDGTLLSADLYRPDVEGPVPVLVRRTPYGKSGSPGGASVDGLRLVRSGYAVLVQDVRGRFGSDGSFEPYWHEAADGADTVAWAVGQPWCDGSAGLFGRSYEAMAALLAAAERPPGLGAIAPHVAGSGFDEGWTRQGGAFQLGFVLYWVLYDLLLEGAGLTGADLDEVARAVDRIDELYRDPDAAAGLLDRLAPYYRQWRAHPGGHPYWRRAAPRESYAAVDVPVLHLTGWYDIFLAGALENYRGIRECGTPSQLVVGPWSHCVTGGIFPQRRYGLAADERSIDVTGLHLDHFDRHLRQRPDVPAADPVRLFVTGVDAWRVFPDWPVPGTRDLVLHLRGRGLTPGPAPEAPGTDRIRHDPADPVPTTGGATALPGQFTGGDCGPLDQRGVEGRADVLCFTGERLTAPLTVIGDTVLTVYVTPDAAGADVTGKLVDVHPDGRAELLCDSVRRLAPGADAASAPGEPAEVTVALGPVGHVFRAGHRIRLEIAASNAPRFDVHPRVLAHHTVHHGGDHPSRLLLPCLPGD